MEFCEKCGGMIVLKERKVACVACHYKPKKKPKIQISEKIEKASEIEIVSEKDATVNPIIDIKCIKCKNDKAQFWTLQTRAGDESETKFYKCTECRHTWRVYK